MLLQILKGFTRIMPYKYVQADPVRTPRDAPGLVRDDPAAGPFEGDADGLVVRVG